MNDGKATADAGGRLSSNGVEIYKSASGRYTWRIVVEADSNSPEAMRRAKALALQVEDELARELSDQVTARKR